MFRVNVSVVTMIFLFTLSFMGCNVTSEVETAKRGAEVSPIVGQPKGAAAEYFADAIANSWTDINKYASRCPRNSDICFDFPMAPIDDSKPRIYGLNGFRNVRDIGGWTGLRLGRVFRGSQMYYVEGYPDGVDPVTKKTLLEDMKIKKDLDLRGVSEWGIIKYGDRRRNEMQVIGIEKISCPFPSYTNLLTHAKIVAEALRHFTKEGNYPVYVHCAGGADRTGSLIMILEALCDVPEKLMDIDYELTSFTRIYGLRSRDCVGNLAWKPYKDAIKSAYSAKTFNESVRRWVIEGVGLTEEEISAIRANLL